MAELTKIAVALMTLDIPFSFNAGIIECCEWIVWTDGKEYKARRNNQAYRSSFTTRRIIELVTQRKVDE
jgi:hypothetical protein